MTNNEMAVIQMFVALASLLIRELRTVFPHRLELEYSCVLVVSHGVLSKPSLLIGHINGSHTEDDVPQINVPATTQILW